MDILELSSNEFLAELASKRSTPGGGAVAALNGAQAAALLSMVLELSRELPGDMDKQDLLSKIHVIQKDFQGRVQQDIEGFKTLMTAYKGGAVSDEHLQTAVAAPLECLALCHQLTSYLETAHEFGNPNLQTDTAIAALLLKETILASELNVLINLRSMKDESYKTSAIDSVGEAKQQLQRLDDIAAEIRNTLI